MIICGVFHELAHIKRWHREPYDTFEDVVKSEYDAETYAIRMVRRHYTKREVRECITNGRSTIELPVFKKRFPAHYRAFSMIYSTKTRT